MPMIRMSESISRLYLPARMRDLACCYDLHMVEDFISLKLMKVPHEDRNQFLACCAAFWQTAPTRGNGCTKRQLGE